MEFLIKEQLHPKSLKKILRQTGCAPLPTPLVLTLQSKMVVNNYTKIIRTQMIIKISLQVSIYDTMKTINGKPSFTPISH